MARQRHLPRAPITEALVDFRVVPREGLPYSELQESFSTMDFGYYVKNPISEGTFGFALPPDGKPETTAEAAQTGLRLHSQDEKYVAQCRLSGFTFSRLPPYEEWVNLIAEARRIWAIYAERLSPKQVIRVATRYINNLQLPMDVGTSYQKYVNKLVDLPDEVPQAIATFLQRFQVVDVETNLRAILTLALDRAAPGERVPVFLDIDAFITTQLDLPTQGMWEILDELRDMKNRCFFGVLTEAAVELY